MTFDMSNPIAYLDPLNCNLNHMMVMLLKDQLNEYLYDAELASLKLNVTTKPGGIDVNMNLSILLLLLFIANIGSHLSVYYTRLQRQAGGIA